MAEAMLIAKRSGLDLVEFWHAIRMSAGNSFLWETCGPNVFRGEYHDSFPIDLMNKDTQLGYEMARKAEVLGFIIGCIDLAPRCPWKCLG